MICKLSGSHGDCGAGFQTSICVLLGFPLPESTVIRGFGTLTGGPLSSQLSRRRPSYALWLRIETHKCVFNNHIYASLRQDRHWGLTPCSPEACYPSVAWKLNKSIHTSLRKAPLGIWIAAKSNWLLSVQTSTLIGCSWSINRCNIENALATPIKEPSIV